MHSDFCLPLRLGAQPPGQASCWICSIAARGAGFRPIFVTVGPGLRRLGQLPTTDRHSACRPISVNRHWSAPSAIARVSRIPSSTSPSMFCPLRMSRVATSQSATGAPGGSQLICDEEPSCPSAVLERQDYSQIGGFELGRSCRLYLCTGEVPPERPAPGKYVSTWDRALVLLRKVRSFPSHLQKGSSIRNSSCPVAAVRAGCGPVKGGMRG